MQLAAILSKSDKEAVSSKVAILRAFQAIILSRITYAAVWIGSATAPDCNAIQAFLNKVKRWCIISDDRNIDDILDCFV